MSGPNSAIWPRRLALTHLPKSIPLAVAPTPTPIPPPQTNFGFTPAHAAQCRESAILIDGNCYLLYGDPDIVDERAICPSQAPRKINDYCYTDLGRAAVRIYVNCQAAWAAGVAPLNRWDRGYSLDLDGDADGVACEQEPR